MKKINVADFYNYAGDNYELWRRLKKAQVKHKIFGFGKVNAINRIDNYEGDKYFKVEVYFQKEDTKKKFTHRSFKNHFTKVSIPDEYLQELKDRQRELQLQKEKEKRRKKKEKRWKSTVRLLKKSIPNKLRVRTEWLPREIYLKLDNADDQLAHLWSKADINDFDPDYVMAKMLSARGAEKVSQKIYLSSGFEVEDISKTQLKSGCSNWKNHDLLVDNKLPLDVKNSRTPVNNKCFFSEYRVPKNKEFRGDEVRIVGVLSPYLQLKFIRDPQKIYWECNPIIYLGETSKSLIDNLTLKYVDGNLSIIQTSNKKLSAWMFNCPVEFYGNRLKIRKTVSSYNLEEIPKVFFEGFNPFPRLLAIGITLTSRWRESLSISQEELYGLLLDARDNNLIPLPDIYLSILTHFLTMVHRSDRENYSPGNYRKLLFDGSMSPIFPAGTYDPLEIIDALCSTLATLWENRNTIQFHQFKGYRFYTGGILQGINKTDDKKITLLAYCGGRIPKKGKCGFSPLIHGQEKTCSECGKLICPKDECGFCSENCQRYMTLLKKH